MIFGEDGIRVEFLRSPSEPLPMSEEAAEEFNVALTAAIRTLHLDLAGEDYNATVAVSRLMQAYGKVLGAVAMASVEEMQNKLVTLAAHCEYIFAKVGE